MQVDADIGDRFAEAERLLVLDGDQPRAVEHRGLVLGADGMTNYDMTLKALSNVLTFFQGSPAFSAEDYPSLDPRIGRIVIRRDLNICFIHYLSIAVKQKEFKLMNS